MSLFSCLLLTLNMYFFNWDSLHARLKRHYEAWSYKKKKYKKIKAYRESVQKKPTVTVKRYLLILDLKPFRYQVTRKHSIGREFQSLAVTGKKLLIQTSLLTSKNGDRKIVQSIRITTRPPLRIRKLPSGVFETCSKLAETISDRNR